MAEMLTMLMAATEKKIDLKEEKTKFEEKKVELATASEDVDDEELTTWISTRR